MNSDVLLCITQNETIPEAFLSKNVVVRTTLKSAINEIMHKNVNKIIISEQFFKKYSLVIQLIANIIYTYEIECYFLSENQYYNFHNVTIIKPKNLETIINKNNNIETPFKSNEKTTTYIYNIIKLAITNNIYNLLQSYNEDFDLTVSRLLDILEKIFLPKNLIVLIKQEYCYKAYKSNNSNLMCCNLINILSEHFKINKNDIIFTNEFENKENQTKDEKIINKFFNVDDDIYYLIQFDENSPFDDTLLNYAITYSNLLLSYLLTQQKKQKEIITDYLTKIYNRKFFDETLKNIIKFSKRHKTPFSLLMFDIDDFKKINDIYGHDSGDTVLIELSNIIKSILRQSDIFARIGGEEFAIILTKTNYKGAQILSEKIRSTVENYKFSFDKEYKVTISIGMISIEEDFNNDYNKLYKLVDNALYKAKKEGKNRVIIERV